jgi:hypothetical protein
VSNDLKPLLGHIIRVQSALARVEQALTEEHMANADDMAVELLARACDDLREFLREAQHV